MTEAADPTIHRLADPKAVAERVADWLTGLASAADGAFAIALAGGSTPKLLYETLAQDRFRARFPWPRVDWFLGDERFVPRDDPESNYRMVKLALFDHAPIPPERIHAVPAPQTGEPDDPGAAAAAYERALQAFYGADRLDPTRPLFAVTLLGVGPDGHTASLFPGDAALAEGARWTAAVIGAKSEPRITLTYPALNSSRRVAFLATGDGKREILTRLKARDPALPSARIRPTGDLLWFVDQAAWPGGADA